MLNHGCVESSEGSPAATGVVVNKGFIVNLRIKKANISPMVVLTSLMYDKTETKM